MLFLSTSCTILLCFVLNVNSVPPDACFEPFKWQDCGGPPKPVLYYWKPGSRCELGYWRGCLPNPNMFKDEYECVSTCIFSARVMPEDYHSFNEIDDSFVTAPPEEGEGHSGESGENGTDTTNDTGDNATGDDATGDDAAPETGDAPDAEATDAPADGDAGAATEEGAVETPEEETTTTTTTTEAAAEEEEAAEE